MSLSNLFDLSERWGRREIKEIWSLGKIQPTISGFEGEWPQAWEDEQPQEAEINPWSRAGKEMGILVLQPQGPDFTPSASREESSTLISALWDT